MAIKFQDYYQTLGIPRNASPDEVQKAYRKLARQYHPDVNKSPGADARFKEINEAYEVLKDPEKRRRYDQLGADWKAGQEFQPPPGWEQVRFNARPGQSSQGFFFRSAPDGFSDFFASLFGNMGSASPDFEDIFERAAHRSPGGRVQTSGQDHVPSPVRAPLTISLTDAYHGATRRLTVQASDGSRREVNVKIPPGVHSGSTIRLRGAGPEGQDLLLDVTIAPDDRFEVEGANLITDLKLAPWEAALGTRLDVPTLDGQVTLTIPPGSSSGQMLRVRGRGLPTSRDHRGDLLVRLKIVLPKTLTDAERQLYEQLRDRSNFNPRA